MSETLKAYIDLTRIQFFFVWPLLFLSGLFLSFPRYGGFDWLLVVKAAAIALLGFEAGFVLNDYIDRELDEKDVEHDKLIKYWRLFGQRPIAAGKVSARNAIMLFLFLAISAGALILLKAALPNHSDCLLWTILYVLTAAGAEIERNGDDLPEFRVVRIT